MFPQNNVLYYNTSSIPIEFIQNKINIPQTYQFKQISSFTTPKAKKNNSFSKNITPKRILYNNIISVSDYFTNNNRSINYQRNEKIPILKNNSKKTLILDVDETLVHSSFYPFSRFPDMVLNIKLNGFNKKIYVLKRPYVDEFLKEISNYFEIITFTASMSQYAAPLLDNLDKQKFVSYRLYRENCIFENGIYIKDLGKIGRELKNIIIIDNNPVSYSKNIDNGIPILTWYSNKNDNELMKLVPILKYLANLDDVRPIIRQIVDRNNKTINFNVANQIIKGNNSCLYNNYKEKEPNKDINYKNIKNIKYSLSNYSFNDYNNSKVNLNSNEQKNNNENNNIIKDINNNNNNIKNIFSYVNIFL
jgi:Dullard-like phosphatase family protein